MLVSDWGRGAGRGVIRGINKLFKGGEEGKGVIKGRIKVWS